MKIPVLTILLFIPISLFSQNELNQKGREYISISGQYFPDQQAVELGYNKYINTRSLFSIHGRYLREGIGYTTVNSGFGTAGYTVKLFKPSEKLFFFGYGMGNFGYEKNSSSVEERALSRWVYGGSLGLYTELQVSEYLSLTINGDINGRFRSLVSNTYYTVRIGINYYLK